MRLQPRIARMLGPDNLLLVATFMMEGLWLYLWFALLRYTGILGWQDVPLTPPSILLVLWCSYYGVQVLGQQRWSSRRAQGMAAALVIVLFVLVARLENGAGYGALDPGWLGYAGRNLSEALFTSLQAGLAGCAYLWWRGYRLAREGLGQEQVFHSFWTGLVGIVLGLLAWETSYQSGNLVGVSRGLGVLVVTVFFFSSMLALALSHLVRVRAEMMRLEGAGAFFSQNWALRLVGLASAMVLLGWLVASVFSFDVLAPVLHLVGVLYGAVAVVIYYLLYPVALLAAGLVYALRWVISRFGPRETVTITLPDFSAFRTVVEEGGDGGVPVWLVLLKWLLLLAILGLALFLLTRLLLSRREGGKPKEALEETHESIGGWREFLRDMVLGLVRLLDWLLARRDAILRRVPLVRRLGVAPGPEEEMAVREMYARLLLETERSGFPRRQEETPLEYLGILEKRLPEERESLGRITGDYVEVRYGEREVPPEEQGLVNRLWRAVYARLKGQQSG
ncbi:MAG: DUF4129 domain-containing protein [Chloroflexi bacterium]|nr:DUF4129 domain-containing protein [Chloroflexota bacterium]